MRASCYVPRMKSSSLGLVDTILTYDLLYFLCKLRMPGPDVVYCAVGV